MMITWDSKNYGISQSRGCYTHFPFHAVFASAQILQNKILTMFTTRFNSILFAWILWSSVVFYIYSLVRSGSQAKQITPCQIESGFKSQFTGYN